MRIGEMIRLFSIILFIVLLASEVGFCTSFELRFSVRIENEADDVFPGSFSVFGNPDTIPSQLIAAPLLHPPVPPSGNYVTIIQSGMPTDYIRESLAYDPNTPDLIYAMDLVSFDEQGTGLSGTCMIQLENPEALQHLPPDCLVFVRRLDDASDFIAGYDLSNVDNYSFQWPVSEVNGLFGKLEFLVVDKCMAADLKIDEMINLEDYAVLASYWNQTDVDASFDIFPDETIDLKDLFVLVEKWLCSCTE